MKTRMMMAALCAAMLGGCGEYVAYSDGPVTASASAGADVLDEETRAAFAEAERLDHLALEGLLSRFLTESEDGLQTFVDYGALSASPEARYQLQQYLGILDLIDPDQLADADERLSFWINAYNANVLLGVIQAWEDDPGYSVSQTGFVFFRVVAYRVAGEVLSLDQIEQGVIRGQMDHPSVSGAESAVRAKIAGWHAQIFPDGPADARIHVALNCASLGCPDLPATRPFAYRAATLDAQLDVASRRFVNNPVKGAGPAGVSALLVSFYPDDFEAEYGDWRGFVEAFSDDASAVNFDGVIEYDWTLNVTPSE